MKVLVTGSSGLIGSTAVRHWDSLGADVIGVDNDMRQVFFGAQGSTRWNLELLLSQTRRFESHAIDIRDREAIFDLIGRHKPELVIHCAAQPSHDKAREIPLVDFDVNAVGTLNILEGVRRHAEHAVVCHMSTNKVLNTPLDSITRGPRITMASMRLVGSTERCIQSLGPRRQQPT
jgi:CDP-paratose 2-epimerase